MPRTIKRVFELARGLGVDRLDAEVILVRVLGVGKAYLITHEDKELSDGAWGVAMGWLERRAGHEPLAYILGEKEFFGRRFEVSRSVLIPRPETEVLVEEALGLAGMEARVIDVGTGSGAIGITMKLERPDLRVVLGDVSEEAMEIARKNAEGLRVEVEFQLSDLMSGVDGQFDMIVANLPYVDKGWGVEKKSPEIEFEPGLALYAEEGGLELIYRLLAQVRAQDCLAEGGRVLLEADPCQHEGIVKFARELGFEREKVRDYVVVLR